MKLKDQVRAPLEPGPSGHRRRGSRKLTRFWLIVLVLAGLGLPGCGDSQSASCIVAPEDFLWFIFTRVGNPQEIMGVTEFEGELLSVEPQNTLPPLDRYLFKAGGTTYSLELVDLGFTLPLTVGNTYSVYVDRAQIEFTPSYGLLIEDDGGVRVIIESDYNDGAGDLVFKEGYGSTGLTVDFTDPGCDPRRANTPEYLAITNRRMRFGLNGEGLSLYHKSQETLGPYTVRVLRAQREQIKAGNEDLFGPQFSFILMPTEDFGRDN